MTTTALTMKEASALTRRKLSAIWPSVRFSVRRSYGTAAGWINVTWTDGPKTEAVDEAIQEMAKYGVAGMITTREMGARGREAVTAVINDRCPQLLPFDEGQANSIVSHEDAGKVIPVLGNTWGCVRMADIVGRVHRSLDLS